MNDVEYQTIVENVRDSLMKKKIILLGYSKAFFKKYYHQIHFELGFTGRKDRFMKLESGEELEFCPISQFEQFTVTDDMLIIVCADGNNIEENIKIFENKKLEEYKDWIIRDFAESVLDEKHICLVAGVCSAQRIADVLNQVEEVKSSINFQRVQVNISKNISGSRRLFEHCIPLVSMYIYTLLGGEYGCFEPYTFKLPSECKIYKIPNFEPNFLFPQMHSLHKKRINPYIVKIQGYTQRIPFELQDTNIEYCIERGMSAQETLAYCLDEDLYSKEELEKNVNKAIRTIEIAEADCNVKVSPIFVEKYKKMQLIRDPLHYHLNLFKEVSKLICQDYGIEIDLKKFNETKMEIPYFHTEICIYPSVYKKLGLQWVNADTKYEVYFNNETRKLNFSQYILAEYEYAIAVKKLKENS